MLFKEPESFKQTNKIGVNIDECKTYRLIALSTPVISRWTLSLNREGATIFQHFRYLSPGVKVRFVSKLKYGLLTVKFVLQKYSFFEKNVLS